MNLAQFRHRPRPIGHLALAALFSMSMSPFAQAQTEPSAVDNAMYFFSEVRDATDCDLRLGDDRRFSFSDGNTSRAAACPDATAWKSLFEGIQAEFWKNWVVDAQMFPLKPLPLCGTAGANPAACCDPNAATNPGYDGDSPGLNCPYFPGDHAGADASVVSPPGTFRAGHGNPVGISGPGRTLRQRSADTVYRNKPAFRYLFDNDLYSRNGLARAFAAAQRAATTQAPFRMVGTKVAFPTESVVFKVNWLHQDYMLDLGLIQRTDAHGNVLDPPQNPDFPYITMEITDSIGDNNNATFRPGLHYLLGFTNATKEAPDWLWFAFEHVGIPGRCDYIGCNDSFGYQNTDVPQGAHQNFIPPHEVPDELFGGASIFTIGETYKSGALSPALAAIYEALGFNDGPAPEPKMPSSTDAAWKSYRLKGTQRQFYTAEGLPTILGNAVNEGGFVDTSSCMTCHTQASVNAEGSMGHPGAGFSVMLNRHGYQNSTNGAAEFSMFYSPGTATLRVLRTDYMWGTLFARPEIRPDELGAAGDTN